MLQVRPLVGTPADRQFYNPARDLANCGLNIVHVGMQFLDHWLKLPETRSYMEANNITDREVYEAVAKFGDMFVDVLTTRAHEAARLSGFDKVRLAVRNLILAAIGYAFTDATFFAVQESFAADGTPPISRDELVKEVKQLCMKRLEN